MDELLKQAKRLVMTSENARKTRQGVKWQTRRIPHQVAVPVPYQTGDLCWIAEPYQIFDKISLPAAKQERVGGLYDDDSFFCIVLTEQETARFRSRKFPYRYTTGRFMYKSLARTIVEIKHV